MSRGTQPWKRERSLSRQSEKLLAKTSRSGRTPALLVLEDGTVFDGLSCGASGETFGEICFNTSMEGYLETVSDPSYAGQIITLTYPQIGNYGVNLDDLQSEHLALSGLVVHQMCNTPSSWRSQMSFPDFLKDCDIVAIEGVDTRALTKHIRDNGAQRAVISTEDLSPDSLLEKVKQSPQLVGVNHVPSVSCDDSYVCDQIDHSHDFAVDNTYDPRFNIVAYDCGIKGSIIQGLMRVGCTITVVPWDTPAETVLDLNPDGVFLSNGPGDPEAVTDTYQQVEKLLGKVPLFGICMGHQMICLAAGASMEKLKFGHRGANQPVMNLLTGRVEITVQNHGFGLLFDTLGPLVPELSDGQTEHKTDLRYWSEKHIAPVVQNEKFGRIRLTHVNLNDGTAEGIQFLDIPAYSTQFHPEAAAGPTDSHYLFTAFAGLMDGNDDYLSIDIARNRLAGWNLSDLKGVL